MGSHAEVSRQLTLIDAALLAAIPDAEFLGKSFTKPETAPHFAELVDAFNRVRLLPAHSWRHVFSHSICLLSGEAVGRVALHGGSVARLGLPARRAPHPLHQDRQGVPFSHAHTHLHHTRTHKEIQERERERTVHAFD
jgi:hypothetical protein